MVTACTSGQPQVTHYTSRALGADPGEALEWRQSYSNVPGADQRRPSEADQTHPQYYYQIKLQCSCSVMTVHYILRCTSLYKPDVNKAINNYHKLYYTQVDWNWGNGTCNVTGYIVDYSGVVEHQSSKTALKTLISNDNSPNTHRCMGKKQILIFFIPDANLTSLISLRYPLPKRRVQTASSYWETSIV